MVTTSPAPPCAPGRPSGYYAAMRWFALLALFWAAGRPREPRLKITGRVTYDGRKLPAGRKVRVQISRDFPGAGGTADYSAKVDASGRFTIDKIAEGQWWLLA